MGEAAAKSFYTIDDYIELEENSHEKYEYHNGEVFMMAGTMPNHSLVSTNFARGIGNALKGRDCSPFDGGLRIYVESMDVILHPDISVICGKVETHETKKSLVINPMVIIEVLSESTEGYDRGDKFAIYRQIPSFKEYILVSQREALIETYYREDETLWHINRITGLDSQVYIRSLDITISLSGIYDRVEFEPMPPKKIQYLD
ncbi:MAG: Uma2 family endonuclease [Spirosomataceae bacterium]